METNASSILKMKKKKRGRKTTDQRSRVFDSHKATVRFVFFIPFSLSNRNNVRDKKTQCLKQLREAEDRSPKGTLDKPIVSLIHAINRHKDYVTTSSCSGRIALFAEPIDAEDKTKGTLTSGLYESHTTKT